MVAYLESVHVGQFITGNRTDVTQKRNIRQINPDYHDPTQVLPIPPPPRCTLSKCEGCDQCTALKAWWKHYELTVDDLLLRANTHTWRGGLETYNTRRAKP